MNIKTLVLGPLSTNCYIVTLGTNAIIIDPADDAKKIIKECEKYNVKEILVTHHHFDHIGALEELEKFYNLKHNDFDNSTFDYKVIKTPGHTNDSISIYFQEENVLFSGDFIFEGTIGRYDFESSNIDDMKNSLELIKKYPKDTIIYPGHGNKTILKNETINFNYYFFY